MERLPARSNLDKRGIDLHSTRCPLCDEDQETEFHLFAKCPISVDVWNAISSWWNLGHLDFGCTHDVLSLADSFPNITGHLHKLLDVVVHVALWVIWRFRNETIFRLQKPRRDSLVSDVKLLSFVWITSRHKKIVLDWNVWPSSIRNLSP